jgi:phosphoketolase
VARGHLWPILGDARYNRVLGYRNRGGTLDEAGMLFANQATWAHVVQAVAELSGIPAQKLLSNEERAALAGTGSPECLR